MGAARPWRGNDEQSAGDGSVAACGRIASGMTSGNRPDGRKAWRSYQRDAGIGLLHDVACRQARQKYGAVPTSRRQAYKTRYQASSGKHQRMTKHSHIDVVVKNAAWRGGVDNVHGLPRHTTVRTLCADAACSMVWFDACYPSFSSPGSARLFLLFIRSGKPVCKITVAQNSWFGGKALSSALKQQHQRRA